MKFWDRVTGADLTREWQAFENRAARLPDGYHPAWEQIKTELFAYGDVTGRNLTAIVDGVLGLLETTAADGQTVTEALGEDIPAFCAAVAGGHGAKHHRDRWREQLNRNVARRLDRLEG
jgi:DNA-binding ferritin-like protein (Dps family)